MEKFVKVLLIESDPKIVSAITGFMSDIRECRLETATSYKEAVEKLPSFGPDLILLAEHSDSAKAIAELRRMSPDAYILSSVLETNQYESQQMKIAGANDCLLKNDRYQIMLVQAVKKALIQISERDAFDPCVQSGLNPMALDENLPDIVFTMDVAGKILHLNRAVSTLLGYDPKEIAGHYLQDFFSEDSLRLRFTEYLKHLGGEIHFHENVGLRNSLGMAESFEIKCAFMEGDHIFGVARKHRLSEGFDHMEVLEDETQVAEPTIPARLDHYRIVTLLGAGGMGRVYLGMDEDLERPVAIKVLSDTLTSDLETLERFKQEAKILASITHPNIALIFQFGAGASPFFCMEYLPGGSVKDLLRKKGTLPAETAASYTLQVALGLNEALSKRVIHLDIKPSNLMLAEDRRIKIVDFGLARKNPEPGEAYQDIVGTPYYVAPEQIHSGIMDYRSDIYSLGITLFEMLYGCVPFYGNSVQETFQKCLEDEVPSREELNPEVPKALDGIMRKMTARDPMQRYATYAELIFDLQNFMKQSTKNVEKRARRILRAASPLWGNLYDRPFAEVFAEIVRESKTGKLSLQWMDLRKEVHFKKGKVVGVVSNQEGEKFVERVLQKHRISPGKAREVLNESKDSYHQYFSITRDADPSALREMARDLQGLALQILQALFRQSFGDFVFEEGVYCEQYGLGMDGREILLLGIKEWMDQETVSNRTFRAHCRMELRTGFQEILKSFPASPSDVFLLFRFDKTILFDQLQLITGIPEPQFSRLIYLFTVLQVLNLKEEASEKAFAPMQAPLSALRYQDGMSRHLHQAGAA